SVVVAREDGKHILICKGAVEEIFAVCSKYALDAETGLLDESHFEAAKQQTFELNSDGFRVVAVAYKEMEPSKTTPISRSSATSPFSIRRRRVPARLSQRWLSRAFRSRFLPATTKSSPERFVTRLG